MNMKTSPQERTMNTNTELPRNAKLLTVEEAVELVKQDQLVVSDGEITRRCYNIPRLIKGTDLVDVGFEGWRRLVIPQASLKEFHECLQRVSESLEESSEPDVCCPQGS